MEAISFPAFHRCKLTHALPVSFRPACTLKRTWGSRVAFIVRSSQSRKLFLDRYGAYVGAAKCQSREVLHTVNDGVKGTESSSNGSVGRQGDQVSAQLVETVQMGLEGEATFVEASSGHREEHSSSDESVAMVGRLEELGMPSRLAVIAGKGGGARNAVTRYSLREDKDLKARVAEDTSEGAKGGVEELLEKAKETLNDLFNQKSPHEKDEANTVNGTVSGGDDAVLTRVRVAREQHIPMKKARLVPAIRKLYTSDQDAARFIAVCTAIESILNAEHQSLLEELRSDYALTHALEEDNEEDAWGGSDTLENETETQHLALSSLSKPSAEGADEVGGRGQAADGGRGGVVQELVQLGSEGLGVQGAPKPSGYQDEIQRRVAAEEHFEANMMELLRQSKFVALSARDLALTAALNEDYLTKLPINVDWASSSRDAIIFRRGYSSEVEAGRMLGIKADYLQSILLKKLVQFAAKPLRVFARWCIERWQTLSQDERARPLLSKAEKWFAEPLPDTDSPPPLDSRDSDPMGAFPRTVPRYEAFLSSAGSRGLLLKRLLVSVGLLADSSNKLADLAEEVSTSEPRLSPRYVRRVAMRDVFQPASKAVAGRNICKRFRALVTVFFSKTQLQEPAYGELVLLYTARLKKKKPSRLWRAWRLKAQNRVKASLMKSQELPQAQEDEGSDEEDVGRLQLKMYRNIPVPDLKVVFPDKKLSYRLVDIVRLDITALFGLIAFAVQYRFDNLGSLQDLILDAIAFGALAYSATKILLGYKRTYNRYQLLVNQTLSEKTLASDFSVVHCLIDASEDQLFKEAALAYGLLLQAGTDETAQGLAERCERFLYDEFRAQVIMPIDSALETLLRLGLVVASTALDADVAKDPPPQVKPPFGWGSFLKAHKDEEAREVRYRAVSLVEALPGLDSRWSSLLLRPSMWAESEP